MVKETETERGKRQVAEHVLLDASGAEAESEEQATGISYKLLDNGKTFAWNWAEANDLERTMLACFGAKTLATNVTSAARNNAKSPADANGQYDELVERFALIRGGQWVDRTREPGVPRVDKDALAAAIVKVMVAAGKCTQADYDATVTARRARLETDKEYLALVRTNAQVATEYNALVGKKTATTDDL